MTLIAARIPIERFSPPSTLFGDHATVRDGVVARALGRFDGRSRLWKRRLDARRGDDSGARAKFFARLREDNRKLGVQDAVVERLEGVAHGATRVVVTGQQPGVLGGPLMTLYKIETAVALAARLEEMHGVPCVPVYWVGADDTDFAEVRELVMPGPDCRTLSTSLPTGAHEVAMPVGDIECGWLKRLWDGLDAFVGGFSGAGDVVGAVDAALSAAADMAGVAARIVVALTGGAVAVCDARAGALREAARGVILDYFDREDEVRATVETEGAALESAGFSAQLALGPSSGVFVLEDGRRQKVAEERRAAVRERLEDDVSIAYPGVVLRNLVQDAVFDPLAAVLGPAEVAYRAQIARVYELLGVEMPVSFPRAFASYVPAAVADVMTETGGDAVSLVTSAPAFVKNVYATQSDPRLEAARRKLYEAFDASAEEFLEAAGKAMNEVSASKTRKRMADVRRRLQQAASGVDDVGRARALERWPFLETLPELLARRGAPQERYLSMLTPFLFAGTLSDAGPREVARAHVDATMDGHVEHIVYSY